MSDGIVGRLFTIAATIAGTVAVIGAFWAGCAPTPRANCYTCVEKCHPFRVSACEPSWSHIQPMYCSCDPFTRVDEPPTTIGPVKGGK